MQKRASRIIIDINLWISFLISKDFTSLDEVIFSKRGILVFSQELLDEFLDVANRPKFRKFFTAADIEEILETIEEYADFIKIKSQLDLCRDPKDNFLLALALDGKVDFLITGDKDLLDLEKFGETNILTITNFLEELSNH